MIAPSVCRFANLLHRPLARSRVHREWFGLQRACGLPQTQWHFARFQSTLEDHRQSTYLVDAPHVDQLDTTQILPLLASSPAQARGSEVPELPTTCPGCGALSHIVGHGEAGFYSRSRKAVKAFMRHQSDLLLQTTNENIPESETPLGEEQSLETPEPRITSETTIQQQEIPVCDRCHDLIYNNKGQSIVHPTVEALADSIAESPFKRNHVYHVLDAADFPMSLIPNVFKALELAKPRSQNRRARIKYTNKPTVSFIVTRSDLLGTSRQMVDRMMPYFQEVLRSALGRQARHIRLGNIHLVSAKRGWWTKELKDSIWERGGGNWMVGKANVGKSNLFPVLFPKGSGERAPVYNELSKAGMSSGHATASQHLVIDETSLLPPAQPEVPFPAMPVVSHLAGTTASPIRLPFGNHKGELIDLPGLERGNLEEHVRPEHKLDLLMQHRPNVKQHIIKPGQSLLLGGGLIRITPQLDINDRSVTMLAYPFVPLEAHVTATDKAIGLQMQDRESGIHTILADRAGSSIKSSGSYSLVTDVTKYRAGPLLRAGVPMSKLPFRVYSCDITIEGVGWVELVCQVRAQRSSTTLNARPALRPDRSEFLKPNNPESVSPSTVNDNVSIGAASEFKPFLEQQISTPNDATLGAEEKFLYPTIEVFSPNGKYIGQRKPLGAWMSWSENRDQQRNGVSIIRPRKSMKGVKKLEKLRSKAAAIVGTRNGGREGIPNSD